MWLATSTAVVLATVLTAAAGQPLLPQLKFNPRIPGFIGGPGEPARWTADDAGPAILTIYGFRPFAGDFDARFRGTLLRDLVVTDMQETAIVGPPVIKAVPVPGADAALAGEFLENYYGAPRAHLRIAILARGAVALIDYSAQGVENYQRHLPGVFEMFRTLSVGAAEPTKPLPAEDARALRGLAGLYLGAAPHFVPSIVLGATPGSGSWMMGTRFYLISPSGRVYRGDGLPKAPGGDINQFDFDRAAREDPYNSGVVAIESSRVVFRFGGGPAPEEYTSPMPKPRGSLTINGTEYKPQPLGNSGR